MIQVLVRCSCNTFSSLKYEDVIAPHFRKLFEIYEYLWGFKRNLFYCRMKKNLLFLFLNPLYLVMLKNTDLNNVLLILQYKRHVSTRVIELKKCEICVVFIFFICSYLFIYFLINSLLFKNCKSLFNIFRYG